ncbi:MAG: TRAP transporter substrate-binding protein DctP, partial [gamma proteobacterium symbiont of Bathyaustriella thionipta]|nr:TRAP transporter substrate-binding protein DctP [gamma proteobacterium symbiont of Bathyaustriella thionipta]
MTEKIKNEQSNRRGFLKKTVGVAAASTVATVPFISNAQAAKTKTWKIQSVWDAGTVGYTVFEEWCNQMVEATGGELAFKPFSAKSVAADNNSLFDAVRNGVLQGMNPFTLYWSGKIPASVFLSSYPAGPDQPHQWDTMFYALGMLEEAQKIYSKFGLHYVGPIHHDANIIHSKKPVNTLADLKGMKIRVPGGMVAEVFQKFGVSTVSLPGSDIFPALEKGTIDAADYVGPAVNWDLGFGQVTDNILFGPPGVMSIYQPVDLMDLTVNARAWKKLSPKLQKIVEDQVRNYSSKHFLTIQKRNIEALD